MQHGKSNIIKYCGTASLVQDFDSDESVSEFGNHFCLNGLKVNKLKEQDNVFEKL